MLQEDKTHSFQFGFFISDIARFLFATVYFLLTLATLHNLPLAENLFWRRGGGKIFLEMGTRENRKSGSKDSTKKKFC